MKNDSKDTPEHPNAFPDAPASVAPDKATVARPRRSEPTNIATEIPESDLKALIETVYHVNSSEDQTEELASVRLTGEVPIDRGTAYRIKRTVDWLDAHPEEIIAVHSEDTEAGTIITLVVRGVGSAEFLVNREMFNGARLMDMVQKRRTLH